MTRVEKFYVWLNDLNKYQNGGFDTSQEAIRWCKENGGVEVEAAIWYSEEAFSNYEEADEFKTVHVKGD